MADTTQFAGLERLNVGEPLTQEFLNRNPTIIDALLRIGAITHRHDAHARLADPAVSPNVVGSDTGGTIPADTSMYIAHTLVDADGGETVISEPTLVTTDPGLPTPDDAPTLEVDTTAGTLLADTYYYALTVVDGTGGETALGPAGSITIDPGYATARIQISGLAAILDDVGGTEWRMWRSIGSGNWHLLNMGSGDTMTDDGTFCADASLAPPSAPTTHSTNKVTVTIPGPAPAGAVSFNVYLSVDGSFSDPCFIANHPIADLGTPIEITSLVLLDGAPPAVSLTLPGANKIDPDTDLVEWHWKRPVATVADLPADGNEDGDVRAVTETGGLFYTWDGDSWNPQPTGSHVIANEIDGSGDLPARARLAFTGDGVVVTDDAGNGQTIVTIAAPPSAGHVIEDEDAPLTARAALDFKGAGVTVTDDAANDRTVVTIPGGGGGGSGPLELGDSVLWNDADGNPAIEIFGDERLDQTPVTQILHPADEPDEIGPMGQNAYDIAGGLLVPHDPAGGGINHATFDTNGYFSGFSTINIGAASRGLQFPNNDSIYRLGIGLGSGQCGVFAWVKAGATWKLQIVYRIDNSVAGGNNDNGYVVVAEADLPAAPLTTDYWWLTFALDRDDTVRATLEAGKTVLAAIPATALPAEAAALYGVAGSNSKYLSTADRWLANDSWQTDSLDFQSFSYHLESKVRLYSGIGAFTETVLFDDTWNRNYKTFPQIGTLNTDWVDDSAQVWVDERRVWHLSGKIHKATGVDPVDGEVLYTFDYPNQPNAGGGVRPVVTGDSDGSELGMVEFDSGASQLIWRGGRSTDPATKNPYVRLDGFDIEGT